VGVFTIRAAASNNTITIMCKREREVEMGPWEDDDIGRRERIGHTRGTGGVLVCVRLTSRVSEARRGLRFSLGFVRYGDGSVRAQGQERERGF